MKKLWNKFTNFLYRKVRQRFVNSVIKDLNVDEEYFRKKLLRATMKTYNPWDVDHEEWIPIRTKKEKDNV